MEERKIYIEPNTVADIGIAYKNGYIVHVNSNAGLISIYKVEEDKKKHIATHLLKYEEKEEVEEDTNNI